MPVGAEDTRRERSQTGGREQLTAVARHIGPQSREPNNTTSERNEITKIDDQEKSERLRVSMGV